jgi:hypothetical protein
VTQSWGSINEPLIHGHEPTKAVNTYRGELPCVEYDFVSLYVCIRDLPDPVSPDGGLPTDGSASNYWKKVDLDFPKRDPRTGNEADPRAHQYTNLIDPTPGDR